MFHVIVVALHSEVDVVVVVAAHYSRNFRKSWCKMVEGEQHSLAYMRPTFDVTELATTTLKWVESTVFWQILATINIGFNYLNSVRVY